MRSEEVGARERNSTPARRIRRGIEGWKALIATQRTSGQTVSAFCAEHGIPRSSFCKWRQKLGATPTKVRAQTRAKQFLPVPIRTTAAPATDISPIELQVGAMRVRLCGAAATRVIDVIITRLAEPA